MPSCTRFFWSCATHSAIHMMLRTSCSLQEGREGEGEASPAGRAGDDRLSGHQQTSKMSQEACGMAMWQQAPGRPQPTSPADIKAPDAHSPTATHLRRMYA